ncbi:MAG: hypothetical protein ACFFC7_16180, partial [Candidatus Hermodarchaeota archaeon]
MIDNILILCSWGPEEEGRLSSMLYLAETTAAVNMNATIFLPWAFIVVTSTLPFSCLSGRVYALALGLLP